MMKLILYITIAYFCVAFITDDYEAWHKRRIEELKSEDGWLNLAGLYWLKEGDNSFGSADTNAIIFPKKAPAHIGVLTLKDGKVSFHPQQGVATQLSENQPNGYVFGNSKPVMMQSGSLRWFIIKRGPKIGIRLRDLEHPALTEFKGIKRFAVNKQWNIAAKFEKPTTPTTIAITDVLGHTSQQPLEGYIVFKVKGKTYKLAATENDDKTLFVIFKDKTSGKETYGAGRFLYPTKPDAMGKINIDFNKSLNPPCAFSPYATCPLPPAQNNLPFRVEAGEKDAEMH